MRSAFHLKTRMPPLNTFENRGIRAPLTEDITIQCLFGALARSRPTAQCVLARQGTIAGKCELAPGFALRAFENDAANRIGKSGMPNAVKHDLHDGALALVTGTFMVGVAIWKKGPLGFLKNFVPPGAPWPLLVVLVPVEVVSFCSRVFALAIRLFANVLAGHILIFALLSMVVLFGWFALPVVLMAVGIYFFEIFMSLLQAYVFTLLSAIFISQMAYEHG